MNKDEQLKKHVSDSDPSRVEKSVSANGLLKIGKVKAPLSEMKALYRQFPEEPHENDERTGPSC